MEQLNARIAECEGQLSAASAALGTTPSELLTRIKDGLQQVVDARAACTRYGRRSRPVYIRTTLM